MAKNKVRPKLTSAQIDAKYIAMGEEMIGGITGKAEAKALAEDNTGKFGRPFEHSNSKIQHLGSLRVHTGAGLRRIEGMARHIYGKKKAPDHTTLCKRINALKTDILPGVALLCDKGRTLIVTIDSTGLGMAKTNGWRIEKHGGKRGYLSLHTVSVEKTGDIIASKLTAPEEGDATQFVDLVEVAIGKCVADPEEREEMVRKKRAELAAGKAVILSRNDGIADTSPEAAARLAISVERLLAEGEHGGPKGGDGARGGGADGDGVGTKKRDAGGRNSRGAGAGAGTSSGGGGNGDDGNGTVKSAAIMSVMARRYAADMGEAAGPIIAAAATQHIAPEPESSIGDSARKGQEGGSGRQSEQRGEPGHSDPQDPPSSSPAADAAAAVAAAAAEEDVAHGRSLSASSALSITECALDALGMDPGGDDFGDDWIKIMARGDAAYDSRNIFDKCHDLGIDPCIRIRRNANLQSRGKGDARPKAVIDQLGGGNPDPDTFYALIKGARHMYQRAWKVIAQYGRRWLHEAEFGSFKVLMGGSIMAVKPSNMVTEVALKIGLYNRLQKVGAEAAAAAIA